MKILSGIQPTGRFHWGNYFGAIRQYIALQGNEQSFYFIADLHALTTVREPAVLRQNVKDAALDLRGSDQFALSGVVSDIGYAHTASVPADFQVSPFVVQWQ